MGHLVSSLVPCTSDLQLPADGQGSRVHAGRREIRLDAFLGSEVGGKDPLKKGFSGVSSYEIIREGTQGEERGLGERSEEKEIRK